MNALTQLDELELAVRGLKRELAEQIRTIANELLLVDEVLSLSPPHLDEAARTALEASGKLAKIALELERLY